MQRTGYQFKYIRTPFEAAPASMQVITPSENIPTEKIIIPEDIRDINSQQKSTKKVSIAVYVLSGIVIIVIAFLVGYSLLKRKGGTL